MSAYNSPFYTDNLSTPLRVAQTIGLTSTAFLAGKTFSASFSAVPALLLAPAPLLAKQWKKQFDADKFLAPAVSLFSVSTFGWIAYRGDAWTKTSIMYATSASLMALLIPYTLLLGEPLIKALQDKERNLAGVSITDASAEAGIAKEETVHALVDKWATMNFGRFVVSAVAAALATWASIDRAEVVPAATRLATGANRMG